MAKNRTWILVADGARGRIFYNEGWQSDLVPVIEDESVAATVPSRDLGTERPGRAQDSTGAGRHAMEPRVDWHQFEKTRFAQKMAALLNKGRIDGAYDRLVLVAPPRTLGDLRAALDKPTQAIIAAELAKDLTGTPLHALPARLEKIMPV